MNLVRDIEKVRYGENSYFHLIENGLFKEPQFEGDYSRITSTNHSDISNLKRSNLELDEI